MTTLAKLRLRPDPLYLLRVTGAIYGEEGRRTRSEQARNLRLLAESPEEFPELPHDAVLVITPKIRKQARDFLAYRQRAEPMDQGMPGC